MRRAMLAVVVAALLAGSTASAQEHWTEGPVWGCAAYRTKEGKFDDYVKYLREHYLVTSAESKKQGLILDSKIFAREPAKADDWNLLICTLHASYGKAMDYDAEAEKKGDAIQAAHWKTANQGEQQKLSAKRYELREFVGMTYSREVTLKPLN